MRERDNLCVSLVNELRLEKCCSRYVVYISIADELDIALTSPCL